MSGILLLAAAVVIVAVLSWYIANERKTKRNRSRGHKFDHPAWGGRQLR